MYMKKSLFEDEEKKPEITKENIAKNFHNIGDRLTCPICDKNFSVTNDTMYIAKNAYVCNWNCFLKNNRDYLRNNAEKKVSNSQLTK